MTFNENMLPTLGVTWRHFGDKKTAMQFATWAESTTKNWEYPCEAFVDYDTDYPEDERWIVKVRNW